MVGYLIYCPILAYFAYSDFREKKIHLYGLLAAGAVGIILRLSALMRTSGTDMMYMIWETLLGIGFGVAMCLLSRLLQGKIGLGDALVLLIGSLFLGFWENLRVCVIALYGIGLTALVLLLTRRKKGNEKIAFLPFLFIAFLVEWGGKEVGVF